MNQRIIKMKKSLFTLLMFGLVYSINAQDQSLDTDPYLGKHDIKLNAIMLIIGAVEVNYEYLLNEESGVGISAFITYDDERINDVEYYISPYYRYYFGKKYAGGFFLEGFGMYNRTDRDIDFLFRDDEENVVNDFALGLGLGAKWLTKSGFVGEINYGIGRNLFNSKDSDFNFVAKFGISLGYRF
mgnify:CR=1 FL=1